MLQGVTPVESSIHIKGLDIHYEYWGRKDRPVMVFFNGVAMNTTSWHRLIPAALGKMDVLLWDFRGQGRSTSDDAPYSVEEMADCLVAIFDALGLEKRNINLLGVSTGSIVAAEVLRRYRHRVNRAVLSGVLLEQSANFKLDSNYGIHMLRENRVDLWAEGLYTKIFSDRFLRQVGSAIIAMQDALVLRYKDRPYALARIVEAQSNYLWEIDRYRPDFENVDTPVLVLAGAEDKLVPPFYQKRVCGMFPNARYKQYADCAHIPFIENTVKVFNDCTRFFLTE